LTCAQFSRNSRHLRISFTSRGALAYIFTQARLLAGGSPEQVGGAIGIAGRTVRRLEGAEIARPREITLSVLARYYGLNVDFIRWLAHQQVDGEELEDAIRRRAEASEVIASNDSRATALMLARLRPGAPLPAKPGPEDELRQDFGALNERRRRMLLQFARELRLAQTEELRQREHAA
jgi:transcriptional regulator with XRE-family HTH domain